MEKNRPQKTKKIKRKKLKLGRVLVFVCLIIVGIFAYKIHDEIYASDIIIVGNRNIKTSTLLKDANLNDKVSFLGSESKICRDIKKNPFISSCKVKHKLNLNLIVKVKELNPLFYYSDNDKLVLNNGKMIDMQNIYDVPTLINYVPKDVLDEFIKKLSKVNYNTIKTISDIEYTPSKNDHDEILDDNRFMLSMNDGNTIYINNKHLYLLNSYDKIYSSVNASKGIFNFDCDYNNYYFEPY